MKSRKNILRITRIILAIFFFTTITLLFMGLGDVFSTWFGWTAKIQFLPALLAFDFVVLAILLAITLLFGRIYCSTVCPLGILQDIFGYFGKKNRYTSSPEKKWLRYSVLAIFCICLIAGISPVVSLLAPYSAYGRIVNSLLRPLYDMLSNAIMVFDIKMDGYHVGYTEIWMRSLATLSIAFLTLVILGWLALRNGRTYCNCICPVGTILSFFSRFSLFRIEIDKNQCSQCSLCERSCKASAIDYKSGRIDSSRCVVCGDCLDKCKHGALEYKISIPRSSVAIEHPDMNKRAMLSGAVLAVGSAALAQAKIKVDGGLAAISEKESPHRETPVTPPGSHSSRHMQLRCTACQLCVSACPNNVLRPSSDPLFLMQPVLSFERGFCRPECTRCSQVCPTSAIRPISKEEKTAIAIGHAVWIEKNCIPVSEGNDCGLCARQCPTAAIQMIDYTTPDGRPARVPAVDNERCIGCGKCEYLCPARPFSAIYVEGNPMHHIH